MPIPDETLQLTLVLEADNSTDLNHTQIIWRLCV